MSSFQLWLHDHPALLLTGTTLLGLVVGSFLNVVIHRLPVMLERGWRRQCQELLGNDSSEASDPPFNIVRPRSRCPHCAQPIHPLHNIPVVSFIWLKGRCAACGRPISWRYPLIELLSGGLSLAVVGYFGATPTALAALGFTWALLALAAIDLDHQILPDIITLPLLWAGLLLNLYPHPLFAPLGSAVVGAAAGYVSLWLVFHAFRLLTGKEGMGYGDFKLFAALGAWLGWQNLPLIILLASFVGAVVGIASIVALGRDRRLPIPFGPFLCAAGWIAMLWGHDITRLYLQLARFTA